MTFVCLFQIISMGKTEFYLQSFSKNTKDIPINKNEIIIGRSPITKIKDSKVSRKHLKLILQDSGILVHQIGANHSLVDGMILSKGQTAVVSQGSEISFLKNAFKYQVMAKNQSTKSDGSSGSASKLTEANNGKPSNHWSSGLLSSMNDPSLAIYSDNQITIIKDKYPKARNHFLVLPKENIPNAKSLNRSHASLLEHMHREGRKVMEPRSSDYRLGYHAIPSMAQLHLHVISQDFDSPFLKTKKHWNSFTTEYFIDADKLLDDLKKNGKATIIEPSSSFKDLLKEDLRCHKCSYKPANMPDLKKHLLNHL